eukprot:scaffold990_cov279-Pinguiococcus_pyrenoidosus.AAC.7
MRLALATTASSCMRCWNLGTAHFCIPRSRRLHGHRGLRKERVRPLRPGRPGPRFGCCSRRGAWPRMARRRGVPRKRRMVVTGRSEGHHLAPCRNGQGTWHTSVTPRRKPRCWTGGTDGSLLLLMHAGSASQATAKSYLEVQKAIQQDSTPLGPQSILAPAGEQRPVATLRRSARQTLVVATHFQLVECGTASATKQRRADAPGTTTRSSGALVADNASTRHDRCDT